MESQFLTWLELTLIVSSILVWLGILTALRMGVKLRTEPRQFVPWRGRHVAVAVFVYLALSALTIPLTEMRYGIDISADMKEASPEIVTWLFASGTLLKLISVLLIVTFLRIDLKSSARDFGWRHGRVLFDIFLGLVGFLAVTVLVYQINDLLLSVYGDPSDESLMHPIERELRQNPTVPMLFWCSLSAIVAAPIAEEFLFRVVLQGWLEKVFFYTQVAAQKLQNPSDEPSTKVVSQEPIVPQMMWQPIVVSSMFFAILHVGHGPDPVPLFFLALALGFMYFKTHRLLPCIMMHAAFNALGMLLLWSTLVGSSGR